jgi:hypothetical protein
MSFTATFCITLIAMLAVIVGMGVGVMFGRRPISGSCGGLNQAGGCALCSGTCPKRKTHEAKHQD